MSNGKLKRLTSNDDTFASPVSNDLFPDHINSNNYIPTNMVDNIRGPVGYDNNQYNNKKNYQRNFIDEEPQINSQEQMPREFNNPPQRENLIVKKHQMGSDDRQRFKNNLTESGKIQKSFQKFGTNKHSENEPTPKQLVNLVKKEKVQPYSINDNLSDQEKFEILINQKQQGIDQKLEGFLRKISKRNDQRELFQEHEDLISKILLEEEELLEFHKKNLDDNIKDIEIESQLLNEVDAPGSDIDKYIFSLKQLLKKKMHSIMNLNDMLYSFENNLKKEKLLNERIHEIVKDNDGQQPQPDQTDPEWNNYIEEEDSSTNQMNHHARNMMNEESPHNRELGMQYHQRDNNNYEINQFSANNNNNGQANYQGSANAHPQNQQYNMYNQFQNGNYDTEENTNTQWEEEQNNEGYGRDQYHPRY